MQQGTKTCQNCKLTFNIEPDYFGFYKKLKVPPPTFCPECRRQRRWAWRNNLSLYSKKCELCGKSVISIYSPDSGIIVYCNKCWWSDKWDPKSYGRDYNFSKPFFTQFNELLKRVPQMAIVNDDGIASLNCEYTHDWWFSKNCYMSFSGWYVENIMYSFFIIAGKDMLDCSNILAKTESMYECINCGHSYRLKYSQICSLCVDSQFMYECRNCTDCFMCAGLLNKKYCFKNREYSKEEYEKILKSYHLDTWSGVEKAQKEYDEFLLSQRRRYAWLRNQNLNCTGDFVGHSKNLKNCFVARECENCRDCQFVTTDKDSADLTLTGQVSECYDSVTCDQSQLNFFALFSVKSQDLRYTQHCHSSKHLFGCTALRNGNYCILNKQYTKEEYENLVPKIIEQMNSFPYADKIGNKYRYGEFYPAELSPFGYNESSAMAPFPLSREEAKSRGYKWQENMQRTSGRETLPPEDIPDSINDVPDGILDQILCCLDCGRNYKIVQNELLFYKKMVIPIPRRCFYCRHKRREKRQNPFKLWHRQCMCQNPEHDHGAQPTGRCPNEFETSYAPDRREVIYCESCYQKEVY